MRAICHSPFACRWLRLRLRLIWRGRAELYDGTLLCHFVNALFPGAVAEVDESGADDATPKNFAAFVRPAYLLPPFRARAELRLGVRGCAACGV